MDINKQYSLMCEYYQHETFNLTYKNKNEYIKYFKAWKKIISILLKLDILPEEQVNPDIFTHMNGNTIRMYADEASWYYDKFIKKYKTHKKILSDNNLTDISKLIDEATEAGQRHYNYYENY